MFVLKFEVKKTTLGGSGRALSEGQGEFSQRVRESSLRGSGRFLSEGQGEFSRRVRESSPHQARQAAVSSPAHLYSRKSAPTSGNFINTPSIS